MNRPEAARPAQATVAEAAVLGGSRRQLPVSVRRPLLPVSPVVSAAPTLPANRLRTPDVDAIFTIDANIERHQNITEAHPTSE